MSKPFPNPPLTMKGGKLVCSVHDERDDFWCLTCLRLSRSKKAGRDAQ